MKRRTALVVLAGMVGLAGPAAADETTFCNAFIQQIPTTITTQGHYCFNRNLATAINTGNAITINVDFVVLDLNNFKLGGGNAGLGTNAVGVFANNRRNITVRNGNIRGFKYGIRLIGANAGNLVVENNVLDANTFRAVETDGDSSVVRNNVVSNNGGSTSPSSAGYAAGIYQYTDSGLHVARDNVVTNTFPIDGGGTYEAVGIWTSSGLVDHNAVFGPPNGYSYSIWAGDNGVCRDNTGFNDWNWSCDVEVGVTNSFGN